MSDNGEEEAEEPVVELGDGPDVEGAPVSRVASRLFFPIEESEVLRREGETTVRTPDGPQTVADVLEQSDEVYFEKNADLVNAVRSVVGTGPVPTVGGNGSDATGGSEQEAEPEVDTDEKRDTDEESETAESEESPEGAGESEDAEVAEGAETAESPATEPEADEGNREADDQGDFEFDDEE